MSPGLGSFTQWLIMETIDPGAWGMVEWVKGIQFDAMEGVDKLQAVSGSQGSIKSFSIASVMKMSDKSSSSKSPG